MKNKVFTLFAIALLTVSCVLFNYANTLNLQPAVVPTMTVIKAHPTNTRLPEPNYSQAIGNCMAVVRDSLKAPSTAKFETPRWGLTAENTILVRGTVDAQNSFGAMIRSEYICETTRNGTLITYRIE